MLFVSEYEYKHAENALNIDYRFVITASHLRYSFYFSYPLKGADYDKCILKLIQKMD